jgi:putative tryptophan/tyrosine transport system substrate-binding protein
MDRRCFLLTSLVGAVAAPLAAEAQQTTKKLWRIGYLGNPSPSLEPDLVSGLRQGLRESGHVEGRDIVIEYQWAEGLYDRLPALAAELVRSRVDVIVTAGTPATLTAKQATQSIPIVMAVVADALGVQLVASLARPGGNVTGLSTLARDLEGKRLELLKEIVPGLSRIAVILNPANPLASLAWKEAQHGAQALRLRLERFEVRAVEEFEAVFAAIARQHPSALSMLVDRFLLAHRARIVAFAARQRLPAMYSYKEFSEIGGLISYAPNYPDMFRRSAAYIDRILKGAKPGDLPIEQPTKFELTINLKTAKALGLTIPPSLLARADQVIE